MGVGERIKQFRKQKGLTQVKLAEKAGISRSYLADVEAERYNPSLATLMDLAQALNVPSSCFLENPGLDFNNLKITEISVGEPNQVSANKPSADGTKFKLDAKFASVTIPSTIAAHFETTDFTEEETEEISNFINFITSKRKK